MHYRCEALSIAGFIQQLAVSYLPRGYYFHVTGRIPRGKNPAEVDRKLIEKYRIGGSKWARARRKLSGLAAVQYLRHLDFFVLLATHGSHRFFEEEAQVIRDARRTPVRYAGYAVSFRGGHSCVRIDRETFRDLKSCFLDLALHRSAAHLEVQLRALPFEPYAPIRSQLLQLVRAVNGKRKAAGFEPVSPRCLRLHRHIIRPFDELPSPRELALASRPSARPDR